MWCAVVRYSEDEAGLPADRPFPAIWRFGLRRSDANAELWLRTDYLVELLQNLPLR
jgi:hypothetical protein